MINEKILNCVKQKIEPILCVGYGATKNMPTAAVKKILMRQLAAALKGLKKGKLTIAFEPVWTISGGLGKAKPVEPKYAAEMIGYIKKETKTARVIYGASITAKNAAELAKLKVIEGGLVGGASLDAREFLKIVKAFSS